MANEMVHGSVGTTMTQAEFEAIGLHVLNSQATGDLIYASSATQLSRLGIAASSILISSGGIPAWSTTLPALTLGGTLTAGGWGIANVGLITFAAGASLYSVVDNSYLDISGGADSNSARLLIYGKSSGVPGSFVFYTPNAALTITQRLQLSGAIDTAVATWSAITHTGLNLTATLAVAGTQVIGARVIDARCDDAINSGDATTDGVIDSLRDAMITHGLIAAA